MFTYSIFVSYSVTLRRAIRLRGHTVSRTGTVNHLPKPNIGWPPSFQIVHISLLCLLWRFGPCMCHKLPQFFFFWGGDVSKQFRFYTVDLLVPRPTPSNVGGPMRCVFVWFVTANLPGIGLGGYVVLRNARSLEPVLRRRTEFVHCGLLSKPQSRRDELSTKCAATDILLRSLADTK